MTSREGAPVSLDCALAVLQEGEERSSNTASYKWWKRGVKQDIRKSQPQIPYYRAPLNTIEQDRQLPLYSATIATVLHADHHILARSIFFEAMRQSFTEPLRSQ